jgi:hypothetical protein
MQQPEGVRSTLAEVVAEQKRLVSPGRILLDAIAEQGLEASVEFDLTITGALPSLRRKPRYPARNLFTIVEASGDPRQRYRQADPPDSAPIPPLHTTSGWVQVPPDLWDDPDAFETFVNYRLVVRLATAENHTLLRAEGGLLQHPGIAHRPLDLPLGPAILAACDELEQADGLILNPTDYYAFLGSGSLMADLEQNGLLVVRTRLVDPGTAIIGDFEQGAVVADAGRSLIRFAEPPSGTFAEPGIGLTAQIYERVLVNQPDRFLILG